MSEEYTKEEIDALNTAYPFIRKWGQEMQSFDYYIIGQQLQAKADGAPSNAIYERDGKWSTTDQIQNPDIRKRWGLDKEIHEQS